MPGMTRMRAQSPRLAALTTALLLGSNNSASAAGDQEDRISLANQVAGLNLAFYEAQRAGSKGSSASLFPQVWKWKKEAFVDACATVRKGMPSSELGSEFTGTFEAGNTVVVTGISAFASAQMVLGASYFHDTFMSKPTAVLPDPAGCLPSNYTDTSVKDLLLKTFEQQALALLGSIVEWSPKDTSAFLMITGVGDSSCFNDHASWDQPASKADRCYVADNDNPAGDVAAQVSTALSLLAFYFRNAPGTPKAISGALADACEEKALAAYAYAAAVTAEHGDAASCAVSTAATNCVGDSCNSNADSPCTLYGTIKAPHSHLFGASGALFKLTGSRKYAKAAAEWWDAGFEQYDAGATYLLNWDNVWGLGCMVLAAAPAAKGAGNPPEFYAEHIGSMLNNWITCSAGTTSNLCKRTGSGQAYPIMTPAGNLGQGINAVCLAGVYAKVQPKDTKTIAASRCFMQQQLGATVNAKCDADPSEAKCGMPGTDGYSYMVGLGENYPNRIHSRDASSKPFDNGRNSKPDVNTICGAIVSGPDEDDCFTDSRRNYMQSEPAIDFASGALCAFGAYANVPDGGFDSCDSRGPLAGV